jgi:hypothetical protein
MNDMRDAGAFKRGAVGSCLASAGTIAAAAGAELAMGRKIWGVAGRPGFWSGDVRSPHNSQYFSDPYSFTHILHGFVFFGLLHVFARRSSLWTRAFIAIALESAWEALENTNMVIERYRTATLSLHYYGDSVVNSVGDILFCALGFYLASRLPAKWTAATFVAVEAVLLFTIRDGLMLNVLMLIHPVHRIKMWQLALH